MLPMAIWPYCTATPDPGPRFPPVADRNLRAQPGEGLRPSSFPGVSLKAEAGHSFSVRTLRRFCQCIATEAFPTYFA